MKPHIPEVQPIDADSSLNSAVRPAVDSLTHALIPELQQANPLHQGSIILLLGLFTRSTQCVHGSEGSVHPNLNPYPCPATTPFPYSVPLPLNWSHMHFQNMMLSQLQVHCSNSDRRSQGT